MKEFFCTLIIENRIIKKKMSDLLLMCNNGVLPKVLCENSAPFPFMKKEETFCIDEVFNSVCEIIINAKPFNSKPLSHGDYITIKYNKGEENFSYNLLFTDCKNYKLQFKKYRIEKSMNIFIGRLPENDICIDINDSVSRKHAAIRIDSDGWAFIEDLSRKAGVFLNRIRTNSSKVNLFDEIFIMGISIIFMGDYIAILDMNNKCKLKKYEGTYLKNPEKHEEDTDYFVRSPRILKSLEKGVFEIDPPTQRQQHKKIPVILTVGPSLTMALAMITSLGFSIVRATSGGSLSSVMTSGVMAISMLLGAIMWPTLMNNYHKRQEIADEKYRCKKYEQYIEKKENELSEKYKRNQRVWNEVLAPGPEKLCQFIDNKEKMIRLWERSPDDLDFLLIRLGSGKKDLGIKIAIPKDGFVLDNDELFEKPKRLFDKYHVLDNVPICISLLEQKTIGLIGCRKNILTICKNLVINILSLHSYDEVKTVFVYNENEKKQFEWVRELPSTWSNDRSIRYIATNKNEVHQVFNSIDEIVKEREERIEREHNNIPYFIIFVMDEHLTQNEALNRYIENANNNVGISSVFVFGEISKLPKECSSIIQSDDTVCGVYSKNKNDNKFIKFTCDEIVEDKVIKFASVLSNLPVKVDIKNLSVPSRVGFLQMYKTGNVEGLNIQKHWDNNESNKTLAAPIGIKAGGEVFSLDLHEGYHGCHGLVAGMTGSGKSEFLQAYILSMIINYSPNEVAFVLVDFKGGDMARPFMGKDATSISQYTPSIPHLAATISNLSGNVLYRALVSFEAEIKKRQNIFNESAALLGIDKIDINSYHRYFKDGKLETPLPHLIIVIDEFAQLKSQQPEFLTQLINIAQVGRSLGIHLILATQRPSGVVDPQIWSNSRFKVCLKVSDKQDSAEIINRPDAAMIKLPGRCYIQVGYDEIFECIQSGYSGAEYTPTNTYIKDEELTVHLVDNTAIPLRSAKDKIAVQKTGKTQLEEIVKVITQYGVKKTIRVKPLWCDMLKDKIYIDELINIKGNDSRISLSVSIALADLVKSQKQLPLLIDFLEDGHIALYGSSGAGKTTFLQTLLYSLAIKYTPDEVNFYIFDFSGRTLNYFNILPHCGDVIFSDDEKLVFETIEYIQSIINERKVLFANNNCGSYKEYLTSSDDKLPAIIVVVDNYTPFREIFYSLEDSFVNIVSSGIAYGIHVVLTGNSKNSIYYKATEHISTFYTLRMNDRSNYRDILNVPIPIDPDNIKGRGITVLDGTIVEFQTALVFKTENESERVNLICEKFEQIAKGWSGKLPSKISEVKDTTVKSNKDNKLHIKKSMYRKINTPEAIEQTPHTFFVGRSVVGDMSYGVNLDQFKALVICGKKSSNKINIMKYLMSNTCIYSNRNIVLVDNDETQLKGIYEANEKYKYIHNSSEFDDFIYDIQNEFNIRREKLEELRDSGSSHETIYGNMFIFEKVFIFINNFSSFFDMISDEAADSLTNLVRECDNLGIYFITFANFEDLPAYSSAELYKYLIKTPDGIIIDRIEPKHIGLLCEKLIDLQLTSKDENNDEQVVFYTNGKSAKIICE